MEHNFLILFYNNIMHTMTTTATEHVPIGYMHMFHRTGA